MTHQDDSDEQLIAGRYRRGEPLGHGGMSTVYRGVDEALGRPVAIKILSPLASDASAVDRARSEIRLLASLSHRGLVTLYDAGSADIGGVPKTLLVMELVDDPSLAERLQRGPLSEDEGRLVLGEMAEALHAIHARGVVHCDIKPSNILLAPSPLVGRMGRSEIAMRLMSAETSVPLQNMRKGTVDARDWTTIAQTRTATARPTP